MPHSGLSACQPHHQYVQYIKSWGATAVFLALAACASTPPPAPPPEPEPVVEPAPVIYEPAPAAPTRYVVKKGDTLWDISTMFLADPWLWPEIWYVNPQVQNPHLIYPGDVLTLFWRDGKAYLQLERGGEVVQTTLPGTRISPKIRTQPLDLAIPTIPLDAIRAFLNQSYVVTDDELEEAPYVLRSVGGQLMSGANMPVYVRGITDPRVARYAIVRAGGEYEDPENGDTLGYEARYLGEGEIVSRGDPATLKLTVSKREILSGDRLIPAFGNTFNLNFLPSAPDTQINARIISVFDGVSQIGQYMVIVLSRGAADGVEAGNVLAIYQRGGTIEDPYAGILFDENVQLPDQRAGLALVFRTFDRVSYALVMHATSEIHLNDVARNP